MYTRYLRRIFAYAAIPITIAIGISYAHAKDSQKRFSCTKFIVPSKGEVIVDVKDNEEKVTLEVVVGKSGDQATLINIMRNTPCPPPDYIRTLEKIKANKK